MTEAAGKKGWIVWALGLSLSFNLTFLAAFTFSEFCSRRARCKPFPPAQSALYLTPEQEKSLKEGRAKLEDDIAPLREEMAGHCQRLSEVLASQEPARDALRAETAAIAGLQRRVQEMILDHHLAERASLPPEQRRYLSDLLRAGLCGSSSCAHGGKSPSCEKTDPNSTDCGHGGPHEPRH